MKKFNREYSDIDFSNKKILITGGAGFIGSNLAFYFQNEFPKAEVVVFDKFRNGETFENGNLKYLGDFHNLIGFKDEVITGDINSKEDLEKLEKFEFDYIFHEAAISDTTAKDQNLMMETNVNAFKSILNLAKLSNATLVYASSAATYGNAESPQKVGRESPENIYGFSKLMMDNLAMKFSASNPEMRIVGLRYFNVYGEREFFKGKTASMILQFGLQILSGKSPKLFEGSYEIERDFIYIEDIVQANIRATSGKSGVYNVGTGKARSFGEIVDILQKELGTNLENQFIPNPFAKQYQFHTEADISNTEKFLKYSPQFSLENGISKYVPEIRRIFENS
jgi:ADP-L-glycero-D-manno-heptose 6-epimerase